MTLKDIKRIPLGKVRVYMNNGAKIDGLIVKEECYYILSNDEALNGFDADNKLGYNYSWMIYRKVDLERIDRITSTNSHKDVNLYNLKQYDSKGI